MRLNQLLDFSLADAPPPPGALDLLSALKDIHEPPPPGIWPPAPGWWMLGAILLAAVFLITRWVRQRRRQSLPIRIALTELDAWKISAPKRDPAEAADELAALLRRAALVRYPRDRVAPLVGDAWLEFLDQTVGTHAFSQGPGRILGNDRYAADVSLDAVALEALARRWLREHMDGRTIELDAEPPAPATPMSRAA